MMGLGVRPIQRVRARVCWRRNLPRPFTHLVIDVEVSLSRILADHTGFFQQEVVDFAPVRLPTAAELDLKIFALGGVGGKTGGVS